MAGALRLWPPEIQRAPLEPRAAAHPRASEPLNGAKERKRTPHTQSPGTGKKQLEQERGPLKRCLEK